MRMKSILLPHRILIMKQEHFKRKENQQKTSDKELITDFFQRTEVFYRDIDKH